MAIWFRPRCRMSLLRWHCSVWGLGAACFSSVPCGMSLLWWHSSVWGLGVACFFLWWYLGGACVTRFYMSSTLTKHYLQVSSFLSTFLQVTHGTGCYTRNRLESLFYFILLIMPFSIRLWEFALEACGGGGGGGGQNLLIARTDCVIARHDFC